MWVVGEVGYIKMASELTEKEQQHFSGKM